jgi:hypothetical protein
MTNEQEWQRRVRAVIGTNRWLKTNSRDRNAAAAIRGGVRVGRMSEFSEFRQYVAIEGDMDFHPLANLFLLIEGAEFDDLGRYQRARIA